MRRLGKLGISVCATMLLSLYGCGGSKTTKPTTAHYSEPPELKWSIAQWGAADLSVGVGSTGDDLIATITLQIPNALVRLYDRDGEKIVEVPLLEEGVWYSDNIELTPWGLFLASTDTLYAISETGSIYQRLPIPDSKGIIDMASSDTDMYIATVANGGGVGIRKMSISDSGVYKAWTGSVAGSVAGLAVDRSSQYLYLGTLIPGPDLSAVRKFTTGGVLLTEWGLAGDGPGQYKRLSDIAVDKDGNVYIADIDGDRVYKCTPDGVLTWTIAVREPTDIDVGDDFSVYVLTEDSNHREVLAKFGY